MKKYILSIVISICFFGQSMSQVITNPFMKVEGMPASDYSTDTTKLATYNLSNLSMSESRAFYNVLKGMDEFSLADTDLKAMQLLKDYLRSKMKVASTTATVKISVTYKVMAAYDVYVRSFTDAEIIRKEKELMLLKEQASSANKVRVQALDLEKANRIRNRNSAFETQRIKF